MGRDGWLRRHRLLLESMVLLASMVLPAPGIFGVAKPAPGVHTECLGAKAVLAIPSEPACRSATFPAEAALPTSHLSQQD